LASSERRRLDAGQPERRHLVFHQRNQRRHDEADARPDQRRDLVAERLAAAGRHQDEGAVSGDHTCSMISRCCPRKAS